MQPNNSARSKVYRTYICTANSTSGRPNRVIQTRVRRYDGRSLSSPGECSLEPDLLSSGSCTSRVVFERFTSFPGLCFDSTITCSPGCLCPSKTAGSGGMIYFSGGCGTGLGGMTPAATCMALNFFLLRRTR